MSDQHDRRKNDIKILEEIHGLRTTLDLNERMHKLELQVHGISLFVENKKEKIDEHHRTLFGENGKDGLFTEVDRLKVDYKAREGHIVWIFGILGTIIAAIIAGALIAYFKIH